ncbi:unnamed protein product [Chrysoparadoxa australica]
MRSLGLLALLSSGSLAVASSCPHNEGMRRVRKLTRVQESEKQGVATTTVSHDAGATAAEVLDAGSTGPALESFPPGPDATVTAYAYLHTANSRFGTYMEGCSVDQDGNVFAVNYGGASGDFEGGQAAHRDTLAQVLFTKPRDEEETPSLWASGEGGDGQWLGVSFLRSDTDDERRALVADRASKSIKMVTVSSDGQSITDFCGGPDEGMLEPNDLVVASNGRVFITGNRWRPATTIGDGDLWTCRGDTREATQLAVDPVLQNSLLDRTNGIELSPDEDYLYVTETTNAAGRPHTSRILRYHVDIVTGVVGEPSVFYDFGEDDGPDGTGVDMGGLVTDQLGNLYVARTGGREVVVIDSEGTKVLTIELTYSNPTNLEFGGPNGEILYIVGRCGNASNRTIWGQEVTVDADGVETGGVYGCVDTWKCPYAGRTWSALQQEA